MMDWNVITLSGWSSITSCSTHNPWSEGGGFQFWPRWRSTVESSSESFT